VATFTRQGLLDALNEVVDELAAAGVAARVRIVGGAAIVLAHDPERGVTRDVDALLASPRDEVLAAARRVAQRQGWPQDWLNTDAQMYSPDPDHPEPAWELFIERDEVIIEVATAGFLLAMKLHAARGLRDTDDIEVLVGRCSLRSIEDAIELYEAHYHADPLPDRALAKLRQLLGQPDA
jgi:hypothetical protein